MVVLAAMVVTGLAYLWAYPRDPSVLPSPALPQWWAWTDQGRYLRAAMAWADLDLRPALHWYPAGYALLGAPFVRLIPSNPFYLVDLLCLLLTAGLTVAIGARLAPDRAWGRVGVGVAFCLAVPFNTLQLRSYLQPWTSTPVVPLFLGALLLALTLWERPGVARAIATGVTVGAITLFRPADALAPAVAIGLASLGMVRGRIVAAIVGGAALPVLGAALLHLAIDGLNRGAYMESAAATGFEWRLLPYRWVTIMVSAAPEWPGLDSLAAAFPVFWLGAAGTIACLVATSGRRRRAHFALAGAAWLQAGLFLCYRDLHADGLFRFGNYHYFKACVPVLALYSWFLIAVVVQAERRWWAWGAGIAGAALAFSWRVSWAVGPSVPAVIEGGTLASAALARRVGEADYVEARGDFLAIYLGDQWLEAEGRHLPGNENFKLVPWREGFLFVPLRPLPAGPAILHVNEGVQLLGPVMVAKTRYWLLWPDLPALGRRLARRWW